LHPLSGERRDFRWIAIAREMNAFRREVASLVPFFTFPVDSPNTHTYHHENLSKLPYCYHLITVADYPSRASRNVGGAGAPGGEGGTLQRYPPMGGDISDKESKESKVKVQSEASRIPENWNRPADEIRGFWRKISNYSE